MDGSSVYHKHSPRWHPETRNTNKKCESRIPEPTWQRPTQGPSWGYLKVNFSETLSIFGDKRPRNGSKNGEMAPRTGTGCPHIGPFVVSPTRASTTPTPATRNPNPGTRHPNPETPNRRIRHCRLLSSIPTGPLMSFRGSWSLGNLNLLDYFHPGSQAL